MISGSISFFARTVMSVARWVDGFLQEIVEGSQQQSLWAINEGGENDRAWNRLVEAFGSPIRCGSRGRELKARRFRKEVFRRDANLAEVWQRHFVERAVALAQRSVEERRV